MGYLRNSVDAACKILPISMHCGFSMPVSSLNCGAQGTALMAGELLVGEAHAAPPSCFRMRSVTVCGLPKLMVLP
jgi:hypothetical protein